MVELSIDNLQNAPWRGRKKREKKCNVRAVRFVCETKTNFFSLFGYQKYYYT